jgi:DNA-binding transcriptional MerR regulator
MSKYTISELAEAAGLPVRTVRYYRATGLLQGAPREGRAMQYDDAHLHRLLQIAELHEHGLKLDAIRELVNDGAVGLAPAAAVLGASPSGDPWLTDSERDFSIPELAELLGERYFDLLGPLEQAGFLERRSEDGATIWHCPDLPLLRGALQLSKAGSDVALCARARDVLIRRTRRLADDLLRMWAEESGATDDDARTKLPQLEQIRLVAWQSAAYVMAKEIERAMLAQQASDNDQR